MKCKLHKVIILILLKKKNKFFKKTIFKEIIFKTIIYLNLKMTLKLTNI